MAQTRLLDDSAAIGSLMNAAMRKLDALENEVCVKFRFSSHSIVNKVMSVKQENAALKSFVVEMTAHLQQQMNLSQNQLVKLILDMSPK